jgi:sulfatase modifying factor 1
MNLTTVLAAYGLVISQTFATPSGHSWLLLNDKHWMLDSGAAIPIPASNICGPNMVLVEGEMKLDPDPNLYSGKTIDQLQKKACISWIERQEPLDKCAVYDRDKWLQISSGFKTKHMKFCIDKYEAPNIVGQNPIIMVNLLEAEELCSNIGKRICSEDEMTFACEGPEALPYGYGTGYSRDATACVQDKTWKPYHASAFYPRNTSRLASELDQLWQGEPSGSRNRCITPFGVQDFPGNVDEITLSTHPGTSKLALKGGYFSGHVRNRCRATTRSHDQNHIFYQEGFRCCNFL